MHSRRSIRLRAHDYRGPGAYFITVCTDRMLPTLGSVTAGGFAPSTLGKIVAWAWKAIPEHFPTVSLDAWCVMPNHLHGILWLAPADGHPELSPQLGVVVRQFKAAAARGTKLSPGRHDRRIWHRNYYERIIRTRDQLRATRRYIDLNPRRWWEDRMQGSR